MGLLVCSQNDENCQNCTTLCAYFDGTAVIGIRRPGQQSIKIKCVHVGVEYQKNALYALLRRFSGGLGIKLFATYQINFKRIIVASDDKKEAS